MRTEAEIKALVESFEQGIKQNEDDMVIEAMILGSPSPKMMAASIGAMMVLEVLQWVQGKESDAVKEFLKDQSEESGSHQCEVTAVTAVIGEDSTPE